MSRSEGLGEYVLRVMRERRLSFAEVERRSGGEISDSYVYKITTGPTGSLTVDKLKALARGLGVSEDEVFAAARGISRREGKRNGFEMSDFALLYREYRNLTARHRREVNVLLHSLRREIKWRQRPSAEG